MTFYLNADQDWYTSGPMGYAATWKDVVASGSEVGNHTYHHCYEDLTAAQGHPLPRRFATAAEENDGMSV